LSLPMPMGITGNESRRVRDAATESSGIEFPRSLPAGIRTDQVRTAVISWR
jgi:hypothetical protein